MNFEAYHRQRSNDLIVGKILVVSQQDAILLLGGETLTPTGFIHEVVVSLYLQYRSGAVHQLGTKTAPVANVVVVIC